MSKLFSSVHIGKLELHSRLVMPPMATAKSAADGSVTPELCAYYDEKTAGGHLGLVIVEHAYVSPEGQASAGQLSVATYACISGLRRLVEVIHKNGVKAMAQLNHAGSSAKTEVTGLPVLGASAVENPRKGSVPVEMTVADIRRITEDFASAARRVKEAGFDGVEIHSAHGYMLNQFYSPLTNKRTDGYGGVTAAERIRFHLEVLQRVREVVGPDFPIALRLGACDYMEGGSTLDDARLAAKLFEEAGLDLLDISGGFNGYACPGKQRQGYFSPVTETLVHERRIPVLLTGGITEAQAAEELLVAHKADLIGVGRALLQDSEWAKRAHGELG